MKVSMLFLVGIFGNFCKGDRQGSDEYEKENKRKDEGFWKLGLRIATMRL